MTYPDNMIVLTTGASGSSVLAGLLSSQGYWLGEETKKLRFNTYENARLVDLNMELLSLSGYSHRDGNDIPPPDVEAIERLQTEIDTTRFDRFMETCSRNSPWLWKDPRLSYTIHFWKKYETVRAADYVFIGRDSRQSYAGLLLSRKVPLSPAEHDLMNRNYTVSIDRFVDGYQIPVHNCLFEDMILEPENFLQDLNRRFELGLGMEDLLAVYKGALYRKRYSGIDCIRARIAYWAYRYLRGDHIRFPRGDRPPGK